MTTTSATIRAASTYLARGWAPTPVEERSKRPLLHGHQPAVDVARVLERELGAGDVPSGSRCTRGASATPSMAA